MANLQRGIIIGFYVLGNGVDSVATLDLLRDPYLILAGSNFGVDVRNWFTESPRFTQPIGISGAEPNSASLSGNVITLTFTPSQIPTGQTLVELTLLF
jgi:hypothetical protein